MTRRTRKLLGTVILLIFVCVYALLAMALAQANIIQHSPGFVQGLFYMVLGLGWILPVLPLISWMERPDRKV